MSNGREPLNRRSFLLITLGVVTPNVAEARYNSPRRRRERKERYKRWVEERERYRQERQETPTEQFIREWGSYGKEE